MIVLRKLSDEIGWLLVVFFAPLVIIRSALMYGLCIGMASGVNAAIFFSILVVFWFMKPAPFAAIMAVVILRTDASTFLQYWFGKDRYIDLAAFFVGLVFFFVMLERRSRQIKRILRERSGG